MCFVNKSVVRKFLLIICVLISQLTFSQNKNILFIAVDDLKPLLGVYGDELAITPNIDRLAKMGVTFTNAHCQQAVCAPSRASLLTGLRPDLTEVWDLKTHIRNKNPDIKTLPQYFKENGYTSVGMGKIFDSRSVDKDLDKASWSIPFIKPEIEDKVHGKPSVRGFQSKENKAIYANLKKEGKTKGLEKNKLNQFMMKNHKPSTESIYISDEGYFDGALAFEAIQQLEKLGKEKNPFLLCVGFHKPHLPFVAPKKYWDLYKREEMPLASYQKWAIGTVKVSYHNIGEIKSYTDIPDSFDENGLINEAKQRELIHGYYACVSYIDAQIGKILDALEAQNLTQNTSVVLWGDHGWHLGDHGLWNKHSNFEQATRSPLIVVDADMENAILNDSPIEFVDIFPTLCDLVGLPTPEILQGKSLKPILLGKKKKVKQFAMSQYPRGKIMGYALRDDRYRYVAWYRDSKGKHPIETDILAKELYDYKKDPLETANIVAVNSDLAIEFQEILNNFLYEQTTQKRAFKKTQRVARKKKKEAVTKATYSGKNLMKNPSFENGQGKWRFGKNGVVEIVESEAKSGKFSLQFTGTKCSAFQNLENLKPETTYNVSVFAKTENKEAVLLKVRFYGDEDITVRYAKPNYETISTTFTTGKDHTSARIAFVKYKPNATGKSWFDDVKVTEVGAKTSSIKEIINENHDGKLYIGATIGYAQLGTPVEDILTREFNYTVAENAGKQARVHPHPKKWDWSQINAIVKMAEKNNLMVRLHGPISPQASHWAKNDERTPQQLEKNMTEFMTEQCKKFNGHPNIKWMDVVNETVTPKGEWFGPKKGVDQWENPWTIIGSDTDKNKTPIYISKAFEIANEHASDVKLVFNQHGGMEKAMWERVKETILYLRKKGLRVDGIGWQAHLSSREDLAFNNEKLAYFSSLIDWAHANDLEFHVTEMDYKIREAVTESALEKQGKAYVNILNVLLLKHASGVVTFNTWGITDGVGKHKDSARFLFDEDGVAKPSYYALKDALESAK
jgi:arylsulfatase A-like enzyme/GH35 family endo-1,4-beta-xylanase